MTDTDSYVTTHPTSARSQIHVSGKTVRTVTPFSGGGPRGPPGPAIGALKATTGNAGKKKTNSQICMGSRYVLLQ